VGAPLVALFLLLASTIAGCKGPSYIEIDPTDLSFDRRGQIQQIKAKAMDQQGHYYPEVLFDWVAEKPDVVKVDLKGRVEVVGAGTSFVYARANKLEARALARVTLIEKIEVDESNRQIVLSLDEGERMVPNVKLIDNNGKAVLNRQVFFKARDAAIVSVDRQGGLWPQALGETIVDAEIEGFKAEIQVKVKK